MWVFSVAIRYKLRIDRYSVWFNKVHTHPVYSGKTLKWANVFRVGCGVSYGGGGGMLAVNAY